MSDIKLLTPDELARLTKPYSIRLTEAEILKLKTIGMDRLRAWLRRTPSKD